MKKPIEFTAKRIDNGKWVCGYLSAEDEITVFEYDESVGFATSESYKVKIETVSQFTGRKLVKGHKVYEGTIAFIEKEHNFGDERTYVVCVWIDEWSMWAWLENYELRNYKDDGVEGLDADFFWSYTMIDSEIYHYAGNIFDNAGLLTRIYTQ